MAASASTTSSPSSEVRLPHPDLGVPISDERKDRINKELLNKEVRVLDFTVLLNNAAMLKKEKEENYRGEIPEENEYCRPCPI